MSISDASMRFPRQFDGGRLEVRFSLSCILDKGLSEAQDDLDDGRDAEALVQIVEQVDDRHADKESCL